MMKQYLSLLLALCLCLGTVPTAALAAEGDSAQPVGLAEVQAGEAEPEPSAEPSDEPSAEPSPEPETSDFVIKDGVLTKYTGPGGDVVIPDGVTEIIRYAFFGCTNLTSVTIPSSVTVIGDSAFSNCTNLKTAMVPSATKLYYNPFPKTTKVILVGHSFNIEDGVLKGYRGPGGDVVIPDGVTAIGRNAFSGLTELTSVTIPGSVTEIGDRAFSGCTGLAEVTIPASVTEIDYCAFEGCTNLATAFVPSSTQFYEDDNYPSFPKTTKVILVGHSFTIENGVLKGYKGPGGDITIPDGVTKIVGTYQNNVIHSIFDESITSVTIPSSVTEIGEGAFRNCTGLTSITIPSSITEINKNVFFGCTGLTSITIPNSVTKISSYAFSGCTGLTSVTIPNSVMKIEESAFAGCTSLTSVDVPYSAVFSYSSFPSTTKITRVGGEFFDIRDGRLVGYRGPGGDVVIPDGVTSIQGTYWNDSGVFSPFYGNTKLTGVTIPEGVTYLDQGTFEGCSNLARLTIPGSMKKFELSIFDCPSLSDVTFRPGVQEVSLYAPNLKTISLPDSVEDLTLRTNTLEKLTIPKGVKKLALSVDAMKTLSIPDSVEELSISSTALRELVIPAGVTKLPTLNCPQLTKITFPLNNWVFKGISRADLVQYIQNCPRLEEMVNCPNEFMDDLVAPNKAIRNNWANPKSTIVAQSERINKLAKEITAGKTTDYAKAEAISKWVVDHIKYDDDYYYEALKDYSDVPFDPEEVLDKGKAVCAGYARLTQALLVSQGIPCLYVLGWATGGYHAWNLALLDGEFLWIDNTWGMKYFGLGTYSFSKNHQATSAASFNGVKGPGTLVQGTEAVVDSKTLDELSEAEPTPEPGKFADVPKGSWYEKSVAFVVDKGLFQGVGKDTFAPNGTMTRAMIFTVLARHAGVDTSGGKNWYQKGLDWARERGISDGSAPQSPMTREQLATMLYRYAKPSKPAGDLSKFTDAGRVSSWAKEAMIWAAEAGIVTGKGGGVLDPQGQATRAQVATMLMRFCGMSGAE